MEMNDTDTKSLTSLASVMQLLLMYGYQVLWQRQTRLYFHQPHMFVLQQSLVVKSVFLLKTPKDVALRVRCSDLGIKETLFFFLANIDSILVHICCEIHLS